MQSTLRLPSLRQPAHSVVQQGFTLVEMLIAGGVSAVMMALIANLAVHQIRISDNYFTTATLNRRFNIFSTLLRSEFKEACQLRVDSNPSSANCTPPAASDCGNLTTNVSTPANGSNLRLMIPVYNSATNTTTYPIVQYFTNGTELRRNGPAVNNDGSLSTALPPYTDQLLMNNVSAFVVEVTPDCSTAIFNLTLRLPGTTTTQTVPPFRHYIGKPAQL